MLLCEVAIVCCYAKLLCTTNSHIELLSLYEKDTNNYYVNNRKQKRQRIGHHVIA